MGLRMRHHILDQPATGSLVHLEVGDTLELRLSSVAWGLTMLPYGVVPLEDSSRLRSLVFQAVHGAGGILRLHRDATPDKGEVLDVLLTVREPAPSS